MILRIALAALVVLGTAAYADDDPEARRQALEKEMEARARAVAREARARARAHERVHVSESDAGDEDAASTDTTVVVRAKSRLTLEDFGGSIRVTGWDKNALRVRAEHEADTHIQVEAGPATVTVAAVRLLRIPGGVQARGVHLERVNIPAMVDYELTVPRWMGLKLSGVNTDIDISGVESDVTAETVTGDVRLRGGKGSIKLNSINGEVEAVGARALISAIEVGAVSGDIVLRDVIGPIRVEGVNGDIQLYRVASDDVEASTVSGSVRYDGAFDPGGTYHFASHSGDVVVALPENPDLTVTVDTFNGEFQAGIPVRLEGVKRGKQFSFTLGAGRGDLSLESFSGTIRLVRRGLPPPAPPARPARPAPPAAPAPPGR